MAEPSRPESPGAAHLSGMSNNKNASPALVVTPERVEAAWVESGLERYATAFGVVQATAHVSDAARRVRFLANLGVTVATDAVDDRACCGMCAEGRCPQDPR